MATLTLYRHGMTAGIPPGDTSAPKVKRSTVGGWSQGAIRRNTRFLYSIDERKLTGEGFALTLTVRDCPATADDWHTIRKKFERRLRRMGVIRTHWVTEWQRRGVPHLHAAVYFPTTHVQRIGFPALETAIRRHWLDAGAADLGSARWSQWVVPITGVVGWMQYVSKHAARGLRHYQRSPDSVPAAWQGRTGRMWGKTGDWPTVDGLHIELQDRHGDGGYCVYRRLCRSWRIANARAEQNPMVRAARIRSARAMLTCNEQRLSEVRGVSEWIPTGVALDFCDNLAERGYSVES